MAEGNAKTQIPRLFQKILRRDRLSGLLDGAENEVVCLVAPYGYGKTAGVVSWLRAKGANAAWLTLDASDDDEQAFIKSLAQALLPFAQTPSCKEYFSTENPSDFFRETVRLAAAMEWKADALVLDDYHHIRDLSLSRAIKELLLGILPYTRVILSSRAELSPIFNDFILKRLVCLITIRELSFKIEEMDAYFRLNGHSAPAENLQQIYDDTEGWPAALNVILAISREGPVAYGEDARTYVQGFFETEIWEGLSAEIQDFLVRTSILSELTPAVCYALTDIGETLPILQALFASGLFISRVERDVYRYHRVFHDFLQNKLHSSGIDKKALYKRAGWWYFEREEYGKSFDYFIDADDLYGISQALKIINPVSMGGIENFLKLVGRITELDIGKLKPYPAIVARIALIYFITGDIEKMHSLYPVFSEWSEPGALPITPEEYEEFLFEFGWLTYLDPAEETQENQKHRAWISTISKVTHLQKLMVDRTSVLYFPSMLRGVRDFGDDAIFPTEAILKRVESGEKGLIDLQESVWLANLLLAEFFYEQERFQEAETIVRRVMSFVEQDKITFIYFICTAILVKLIRAYHDKKEVEAITARLKTLIQNNGDTFLMPNFHALELRNRLADGIPGFTKEFLEENVEYEDKPYFYLIYRHFTYVRGLLSTSEYSRALVILGNLELLCEKYRRPTDLLEVSILKSIALYCLGDTSTAQELLADALNRAKPYGYIRIFADDARELFPILTLIRKHSNDAFVKSVVIGCKKALARAGVKPKEQREELTKTELKILKSLQAGMSYEEISQEHNIRVSTVKSHAHSIYSKLQVDNRTSAVMAAQSAGIL